MKIISINENKYTLEKDYKNGYDFDSVNDLYTEYFDSYDYLVGDWSYGKLRLKGFCDKKNKKFNKTNDYKNLDKYIKEQCSYECKYFVLKKVDEK